ncbi:hypothetical protein [Gossypium barbadense]|uniref:Mitochondrial inner membrane protease ATP23 n=1 Tax=Gossypium barbadense TaxID=3634 RepID=A0A5J5NDH8_GOSBA|nr:hypothetical protein [Gossypium barbadense]KAB1670785.1 hypothetical protein [Gossypium barbadense]
MEEESYKKSEGCTIKECQDMIQRSLRTPMVKFLMEHMEKTGCKIVVCSDQVKIQDDVNQVVIHELIHAYDECRASNLDWTNCAHHACSEIRAGHLSGDCHYKREFLRGFMKIRGHEQDCVRRRVMKSLIANPF